LQVSELSDDFEGGAGVNDGAKKPNFVQVLLLVSMQKKCCFTRVLPEFTNAQKVLSCPGFVPSSSRAFWSDECVTPAR
jgi:hypothetical protein